MVLNIIIYKKAGGGILPPVASWRPVDEGEKASLGTRQFQELKGGVVMSQHGHTNITIISEQIVNYICIIFTKYHLYSPWLWIPVLFLTRYNLIISTIHIFIHKLLFLCLLFWDSKKYINYPDLPGVVSIVINIYLNILCEYVRYVQ